MVITDYGLSTNFDNIVHLADIHIENKTDRKDEYVDVFNNLLIDIRNKSINIKNTLIAIAGDIFDNGRKDQQTSPNAHSLFNMLVTSLSQLGTVVIIPGNHDNNITYQSQNDSTKIDILTPHLEKMKNIFYLKDTGIYKLGNIIFYHTSVFDIDKINKPKQYTERLKYLQNRLTSYSECKHIGILHCGIESNVTSSGYLLNNYAYKLSDLEQYDLVLLGDTHEHQFLGKDNRIAYPSSLIQQSHNETLDNHGYILWNLQNLKGEFINIPNNYGFVSINTSKYNSNIVKCYPELIPDKNNTWYIRNIEDIDTIKFPHKSRIKFEVKCDEEDIDIEQIKNSINTKTEIIRFREKRVPQLLNSEDTLDIDNNFNDVEQFLTHLETIHPIDSIEYEYCKDNFINDIDLNKLTLNNKGCLSCIPTSLYVENFQIYKGKHMLIDFEKYNKNSTISIGGNNASGKSTIIRALIFAIWGKDKGVELYSYISWKSNKTLCQFTFTYDNQIYRITRNIIKKTNGDCNTDKPILEIYIDNQWLDKTGDYRTHTQNKINEFFGEINDAKITWLCEQNSNFAFINAKDNYKTFNKLLGIDKFGIIHEKKKKTLKHIDDEIKKNLQLTNAIDITDNQLNEQIGELRLELLTIDQTIIKYNSQFNSENYKKIYGTYNDYNEWKIKLNNDIESESSILNKLTNISEQKFTHDKNQTNSSIDNLQIQKENQIKQLPKITEINTNSTILKTNKQSTDTQILLIDDKLSNINEDEANTKFNTLKSDILLEKQKQKQFNLLKYDIHNRETTLSQIVINDGDLNKLNIQLDKHISKYNDNDTTLKLNLNIKIKETKTQFNKLTSKIYTIRQNLNTNLDKINELNTKIIHIPEKQETIIQNCDKLKEKQQLLNIKEIEFKILTTNIQNNKDNLIKFNNLTFNNECTCCDSNKKHYKIDHFENDKICYSEQLNTIELSIQYFKNTINELIIYKIYNENSINNINIHREITSGESEYENLKLKLDKYTLEHSNLNKLINDYNCFNALNKINKSIQTEIDLLTNQIQLINNEQKKYDSLELEIAILSKQLVTIDFSPSSFDKLTKDYDELENIISLYNEKIQLITDLQNINQNILYNSIQCTILDITSEIDLNKNKLKELELTYTTECLYNAKLDKLSYSIKWLTTKITDYETNGGFDANQIIHIQNNINALENKKQSINTSIGAKQHELHTYLQNCQKCQKYQNELDGFNYDINLLQIYMDIIDPINGGYPIKIINSYLQIFNKKVNEFVKFIGFDYHTSIKPPSDKRGQKLTISHSKKNNLFTELSGAEYFTFKLAILTSLGYLTNLSPPLLIIDEGMSCLDNEHINEIPLVLSYIKKQFNHILYISHNSFLIEKADYQHVIAKTIVDNSVEELLNINIDVDVEELISNNSVDVEFNKSDFTFIEKFKNMSKSEINKELKSRGIKGYTKLGFNECMTLLLKNE